MKAEPPDDDDDDGPDPMVESDDEEDAEREIGVKALLKLIRGKSQRGKEADKITLGAMPNNAKFKAWRAALRQEVAACSSDPDKALNWIMEVERIDASFDNLVKSGLFRTLDTKLASALAKVCSHGLIGQEINTKSEEAAKNNVLLRGRQILLMIYQHYQLGETQGALLGLKHINAVRFRSEAHLEAFKNDWEMVLTNMKSVPDQETLRELLLEQIKGCVQLKEDLAYYGRLDDGHADKSYVFLMHAIKRCINLDRNDKNVSELTHAISNSGYSAGRPAAPAIVGAKEGV